MGMAKTRDRVVDAADTVRPYVERAVKDEELRQNVRDAFDAAREVYNELIGDRGMVPLATKVATDKEIQESLKQAVDDLRKAANRVQGKEEHGGRNTTLLLLGIAIGLLFNPWTGPATRGWLKQRLFGGEEDFTYQGGNSNPAASQAPSEAPSET
jgi:hypothetical protein